MRFRLFALLGAAALGCGAHAGGPTTPESLRGLPARHDAPLDLSDDDDLARARALYEAMPLADGARSPRRRELWAAYQGRITAQLEASREHAFELFERALEMWDTHELSATPVPDLALALPIAEAVRARFSASGNDLETATALAVVQAAQPERTAEVDKAWSEIAAYEDDLAVAEHGEGAQRGRPIQTLENVTAHFPSRWAGEKLVELYLARQKAVVAEIRSSGGHPSILGAQDPRVARPVWNLMRAYLRLARLPDAVPVVDGLSGQFGDDPELRGILKKALSPEAKGDDWLALARAYIPDEQRGGDADAAYLMCAYGAERLPKAVEPRTCASELARLTEHAPLAIRWAEETRAIAPDNHDVGEILSRLYLGRLADHMAGERLDAANTDMKQIEDFYIDAHKRWPDKPLEVGLADAYLTYGRGLYNQGEVDGAILHIQKAGKLEPKNTDGVEQLATIAMKEGRYQEAALGYEHAAVMDRPTPLSTKFEGARLRRLAGEAWLQAGDKKKAQALFGQSKASWQELAQANLNSRARAEALTEIGRLQEDLGQHEDAVRSFEAAVDEEPDQAGLYGDAIAFLITRGDYNHALDAYHRALGRPEVTEYLKVYTTLWVLDAARLKGVAPDPLAADYLAGAAKQGSHWYNQLARFKLGQLSFNELLGHADTRGRRAEAYFYEAMNRYAKKDVAGAKKLLGQVVATRMLGFFEYDMATYFLQKGPPG